MASNGQAQELLVFRWINTRFSSECLVLHLNIVLLFLSIKLRNRPPKNNELSVHQTCSLTITPTQRGGVIENLCSCYPDLTNCILFVCFFIILTISRCIQLWTLSQNNQEANIKQYQEKQSSRSRAGKFFLGSCQVVSLSFICWWPLPSLKWFRSKSGVHSLSKPKINQTKLHSL